MNAFLCHSSKDSEIVIEVAKYLTNYLRVFYFEEHQRSNESFVKTIDRELGRYDVFIAFLGEQISKWMELEINTALNITMSSQKKGTPTRDQKHIFVVLLPGQEDVSINFLGSYPRISMSTAEESHMAAYGVAKQIIEKLGLEWFSDDDLPNNPHLFDYEKDITNYYVEKARLERRMKSSSNSDKDHSELLNKYNDIVEKQLQGCPANWPKVTHWDEDQHKNGLDKNRIGDFRPDKAKVTAAALSKYHKPDTDCELCLINGNYSA